MFRHDGSEGKGELEDARFARRGGRPRRLQQSPARRDGPSGSPDGTLLGRAMDPTGVPVEVRLYKTTHDPRCTLVFGFLVSQSLCACTWPGSVPPAPPRLWAAAAPHLWSEASGPTRRRPWVRGSRGEYSSSALGPPPKTRAELPSGPSWGSLSFRTPALRFHRCGRESRVGLGCLLGRERRSV